MSRNWNMPTETWRLALEINRLMRHKKELEEEERRTNSSLDDTDKELEDKTDALDTLEEVSESGLDSQHADQEITQRSDLQSVEENKTEPELEMLQATPEPQDELLTPEEREAKRLADKKHKIAHWNDIWPWGDHLGRKIYRINFLKFQPPPKTLDHLKNSEVFKMIHEMDEQPLRGVGARQGKALAEEDYYSQMHQEGQMKG